MSDLRAAVTDLRSDMDRQFIELQGEVRGHFAWLVGTQVALLLAVVGALVGAYYR